MELPPTTRWTGPVNTGRQALAYHMTQCAVPLAVLAAVGLRRCLAALPASPWRRYLVVAIVIALAVGLGEPLRSAAWRWRDRVLAPQDAEVSRVIARRLVAAAGPEGHLLIVAHDPSVLFYSGLRPASRYIALEYYWRDNLESGLPRFRGLLGPLADPAQTLIDDVRRTRPRFILVPERDPAFQKEAARGGRRAWLARLLQGYHVAGEDPVFTEYERDSG